MAQVSFTVYGYGAPQGSKRSRYNPMTGKTSVRDDSPRTKPWKTQVGVEGAQAMARSGLTLFRGTAVGIRMDFYEPHPQDHFGSGRNAGLLKALWLYARPWKTRTPDLTKLQRAVEDGLIGIVYANDKQVVSHTNNKWYGEPARVEVSVWTIDNDGAAQGTEPRRDGARGTLPRVAI